jgi:hypothetical protein
MVTLTPSQREALKGILARKGYDADTMQVARRDLAVTAKVDPNKTHRPRHGQRRALPRGLRRRTALARRGRSGAAQDHPRLTAPSPVLALLGRAVEPSEARTGVHPMKKNVLLESKPIAGDGIQAPGRVVLCGLGRSFQNYVVWFHNTQDGRFYQGEYFDSGVAALLAFARRCKSEGVLPTVSPQEACEIVIKDLEDRIVAACEGVQS